MGSSAAATKRGPAAHSIAADTSATIDFYTAANQAQLTPLAPNAIAPQGGNQPHTNAAISGHHTTALRCRAYSRRATNETTRGRSARRILCPTHFSVKSGYSRVILTRADGRFAQGSCCRSRRTTPLYALIGTTFGGDGITIFGLPDMRGRIPVGQDRDRAFRPMLWGRKPEPRASRSPSTRCRRTPTSFMHRRPGDPVDSGQHIDPGDA